jgi:hypothetical protein
MIGGDVVVLTLTRKSRLDEAPPLSVAFRRTKAVPV